PGLGDDLGSQEAKDPAGVAGASGFHARRPAPARARAALIALTGQLAASIGDALGVGRATLHAYDFFKWPLLLVVVALLVGLLYRVAPSGKRSVTKWVVLTPGGAVATTSWVLVSIGFEVYANAF